MLRSGPAGLPREFRAGSSFYYDGSHEGCGKHRQASSSAFKVRLRIPSSQSSHLHSSDVTMGPLGWHQALAPRRTSASGQRYMRVAMVPQIVLSNSPNCRAPGSRTTARMSLHMPCVDYRELRGHMVRVRVSACISRGIVFRLRRRPLAPCGTPV